MTTSDAHAKTFQLPIEAAEAYEATFVPAFFAQWSPILCDAAGVGPGQRVLDVACGTGIVARTALDLVGDDGSVVGVDLNEAMLTVAHRVGHGIDWRQGDAGELPIPDRSFDAVLCQMALMFFPDRARAISEMGRVADIGGRVAILVPSDLDRQPAYGPILERAAEIVGPEGASLLSSYFSCGDVEAVAAAAGLQVTEARLVDGRVRYPSVDALVTTEVQSTPLGEWITEEAYEQLRLAAREAVAPFTGPDGSLDAPFECTVVVARRQVVCDHPGTIG